jgi:hypothetical protein
MTQTGLSFGILVIVICLLFAVCKFSPKLNSFFNGQTGRFSGQRQG